MNDSPTDAINTGTTQWNLLSEHPYCLLPEHYFESPGRICLHFERRRINLMRRSQSGTTIILSESDLALRERFSVELRARGYRVLACEDAQDAVEAMASEIVSDHRIEEEFLVCDLRSGKERDAETVLNIAADGVVRTVVSLTKKGQSRLRAELQKAGSHCLSSPISLAAILSILEGVF